MQGLLAPLSLDPEADDDGDADQQSDDQDCQSYQDPSVVEGRCLSDAGLFLCLVDASRQPLEGTVLAAAVALGLRLRTVTLLTSLAHVVVADREGTHYLISRVNSDFFLTLLVGFIAD